MHKLPFLILFVPAIILAGPIDDTLRTVAAAPWSMWSVIALAIVGGCFAVHTYCAKLGKDNAKLIAKQAEIERLETEQRKAARDAQIKDLEVRLTRDIEKLEKDINGIGSSYDKKFTDVKRDYERLDSKLDIKLDEICKRLALVESNSASKVEIAVVNEKLNQMSVDLAKIVTSFEHLRPALSSITKNT